MERILRIWPTLAELASDIGKPYPTVASWKQRGSIPARYDRAIITAAKARGCALTFEDMAIARSMHPQQEQGAA